VKLTTEVQERVQSYAWFRMGVHDEIK
jgi:hypothetical protein